MKRIEIHPLSLLLGGVVTACAALLAGFDGARHVGGDGGFDHVSAEHLSILSHMSIVKLPDGQGGLNETIRISEVNVQIVNGLGATNTINGLGNLIVGYNGLKPGPASNDHTGSHTIVGGESNDYSGFGGFVTGFENAIEGGYSSVSGGWSNLASGAWSSVSGGQENEASASGSSVSGGAMNTADGRMCSVSGGTLNEASGLYSSVSGGYRNTAFSAGASVSGGIIDQRRRTQPEQKHFGVDQRRAEQQSRGSVVVGQRRTASIGEWRQRLARGHSLRGRLERPHSIRSVRSWLRLRVALSGCIDGSAGGCTPNRGRFPVLDPTSGVRECTFGRGHCDGHPRLSVLLFPHPAPTSCGSSRSARGGKERRRAPICSALAHRSHSRSSPCCFP
jgi:hypothetical protein